MPTPHIPPIAKDFLIVGEGSGDTEFFKHLCVLHGLDNFQIESINGKNFEKYFEIVQKRPGVSRLKLLLVVGDCDETPDQSFQLIRKQLKKQKLPYPLRHLEIARWPNHDDKFAVAVMMLPFSVQAGPRVGCLETLILEAARSHLPRFDPCIDAYCRCIGIDNWPKITSVEKLKLRVLLSAASPDEPNVSLGSALNPDRQLIPLNHAAFNDITEFLRNLTNLI